MRLATLKDVDALKALIAVPAQAESMLRPIYGMDTRLLPDETCYMAEESGIMPGCGGRGKR